MEYVRNQYGMVTVKLVLKESMVRYYDQIQQEDRWIQSVRNEDRMFF
jgi:hypothetical protein